MLALVAAPGTAAAAAKDSSHPERRLPTIAAARKMPLNTIVTIEGTVTTPSGVFASSYSDQGFAIQDKTAGIFVSFPKTNIGVKPPRHVVVTGVLQNPNGLLMIAPASAEGVKVGGNDSPVGPRRVRTGSVGEANQGLLVRTVGKITEGPIDDLPYGHKFFIDDDSGAINVYVNLGTHVDVRPLAVGQKITVTGFSSEFDGVPEIDIRSPQDLADARGRVSPR
ncbi:hypothetical protein [Pseudonocardia charpentierae]|uniref:Uncharacterized protein n=1 Tax=Pseudonocardia charpentierae TaxID=3075545 RepID=A0ABU2NDY8_9PSEU|nr:hypothetical protein [Pseudonocardia sp. DSM 45834]MDT0352173.1 hypothetical protein [Pseudonocardia sp. DSM 45834]